jgi:hypothetical protein
VRKDHFPPTPLLNVEEFKDICEMGPRGFDPFDLTLREEVLGFPMLLSEIGFVMFEQQMNGGNLDVLAK